MRTIAEFAFALLFAAAVWWARDPLSGDLRAARALGERYKEAHTQVLETLNRLSSCAFVRDKVFEARKFLLLRQLDMNLRAQETSLLNMFDVIKRHETDARGIQMKFQETGRAISPIKTVGRQTAKINRRQKAVLFRAAGFAGKINARENYATAQLNAEITDVKSKRRRINSYLASLEKPNPEKKPEECCHGVKFRPGKVNLRSAPNLSRKYLMGVITASGVEKIELISRKGPWGLVRLAKNKTAYVWGANIAEAPLVEVKKGGNRGWFYAAAGRRKYKCLTPGERYVLEAEIGTFYKVYDPRYGVGYINKRYAQKA